MATAYVNASVYLVHLDAHEDALLLQHLHKWLPIACGLIERLIK